MDSEQELIEQFFLDDEPDICLGCGVDQNEGVCKPECPSWGSDE